MSKLANGTHIVFIHGDTLLDCVIEGIASEFPTLNSTEYMYIIRTLLGTNFSNDYPYSCIVAHSSQFRRV